MLSAGGFPHRLRWRSHGRRTVFPPCRRQVRYESYTRRIRDHRHRDPNRDQRLLFEQRTRGVFGRQPPDRRHRRRGPTRRRCPRRAAVEPPPVSGDRTRQQQHRQHRRRQRRHRGVGAVSAGRPGGDGIDRRHQLFYHRFRRDRAEILRGRQRRTPRAPSCPPGRRHPATPPAATVYLRGDNRCGQPPDRR